MLAWPLPPLPAGHTGRLLRALLLFSLLFLAAHLAFQICLHTMPRLDWFLEPSCESPRAWEGGARGSRPGRASWRPGEREGVPRPRERPAALPQPGFA